jgi:trans-aconitate 2-methyltransferase
MECILESAKRRCLSLDNHEPCSFPSPPLHSLRYDYDRVVVVSVVVDARKNTREINVREWDPQQYLQFEHERTQPSIDLVARIPLEDPETIIDIGCGPGNSTQILRKRWPRADIVGLDNSEKMIERALKDHPGQKWMIGDASTLEPDQQYDLVFSNAAIHWVPDHHELVPRLFCLVKKGGILAIQVPANNESPLYKIILNVSRSSKWSAFTAGHEDLITYHASEYYYDLLVSLTQDIALWETTYYHILKSHQDLVAWYKSTAMRPLLESLPTDDDRAEFEQEVLTRCKEQYPPQSDGRILYPFKRIFFIARKTVK